MPAYIPHIFCGKCRKTLPYGLTTAMRMQNGKHRYIRVRCHGEETKVDFVETAGQTVVAWPDKSDLEPEKR